MSMQLPIADHQPASAVASIAQRRPARKGDQTRAAIVEAALAIASRSGLEGLTIGSLAEQRQMSKSGVFAHFGSREELQLAVLNEYARRFVDDVLRPAVRKPRGLPRLRALLDNWLALLAREIEAGCLLFAGATEYDDRPGPLRDAMVQIVTGWKAEVLQAIEQAKVCGHLRRRADAEQMLFEIYGLMLVAHHDARLLRSANSVKRARIGLGRVIDGARPTTKSIDKPRQPPARRSTTRNLSDRSSG